MADDEADDLAGDAPHATDVDPPEPRRFTIDELAAATGVPSRTIRFYQSRGALAAPERRGRVAYYDESHVTRLRTIAELQDRGLRLDAIRDALDRLERGGDSLQEWLGVGDRLQAPWTDDRPIVLSEDELRSRLGDLFDRPGMVSALERAEMLERQGDSRPATYLAPSPGLLDVGVELAAAGVDPVTAFEASAILRKRLGRMADELVDYFAARAGDGFGETVAPTDIATAFEALRPQGLRAVQLVFAREMERSLREFVERGGAFSPPKRRR